MSQRFERGRVVAGIEQRGVAADRLEARPRVGLQAGKLVLAVDVHVDRGELSPSAFEERLDSGRLGQERRGNLDGLAFLLKLFDLCRERGDGVLIRSQRGLCLDAFISEIRPESRYVRERCKLSGHRSALARGIDGVFQGFEPTLAAGRFRQFAAELVLQKERVVTFRGRLDPFAAPQRGGFLTLALLLHLRESDVDLRDLAAGLVQLLCVLIELLKDVANLREPGPRGEQRRSEVALARDDRLAARHQFRVVDHRLAQEFVHRHPAEQLRDLGLVLGSFVGSEQRVLGSFPPDQVVRRAVAGAQRHADL